MRSLQPYKPATLSLVRHAATRREVQINDKLAPLEPHPEAVSTTSSVQTAVDQIGTAREEDDADMMAGVRGDIKTIRQTFSLEEVPKEALYVGMAGVVPYLATSAATVALAYDMNYAAHHNVSFLLDPKSAEMLLNIIEPLQIGYGAVIISFLGAIHWGLEWAKFNGDYGFARYRIGILAPAIAWPTTLMPIEYALITQFLAFNWLYFADANAATRGMAPNWYGVYRFVLTFVVGASIVATLVGRGQVSEYLGQPNSALHKVKEWRDERERLMAQEEEDKEKAMAEEGEEDE